MAQISYSYLYLSVLAMKAKSVFGVVLGGGMGPLVKSSTGRNELSSGTALDCFSSWPLELDRSSFKPLRRMLLVSLNVP